MGASWAADLAGASAFPLRPDDPAGVFLTKEAFPNLAADGVGDDAPALQAAIDACCDKGGIVFVPSAKYRLGNTVHIWSGARVIGYGAARPTLLLAPNTPGYGDGKPKYLLHFMGGRPKPGEAARDASNWTFFSGLVNVNLEIAEGNPDAVAVRSNVAQHCVIEQVDFRLGTAAAGIEQVGNVIQNCRFIGGQHGIRTEKTSASWQATVMDCEFQGQTEAAIQTARAGLTLVRVVFRDVPRGVVVPEKDIEELFLQDCRFVQVRQAAVTMDREAEPRNQLNMCGVGCTDTPLLLTWRAGGTELRPPKGACLVDSLTAGLMVEYRAGQPPTRVTGTRHAMRAVDELPALVSDIAPLPPMETWFNVRQAIAAESGDATKGFKKAIAEHQAIYVPTGEYSIAEPLELKADTAIIGLGVRKTTLRVADSAAFKDETNPRALLVAPKGGRCILRGFAIRPSGPLAGFVGIKWMAGPSSLVDDVHFGWFGSRRVPPGQGALYSLWVTDGGGGVFRNIWSPDVHARNGLYVSDTDTPGRIYEMSVEHHRQVECVFERVSGWKVFALQTEEYKGCEKTIAMRLTDCRDITFANAFYYRTLTITEPNHHALEVSGCAGIRWLGVHVFSWGSHPFENLGVCTDTGTTLVEREAAALTLP